MGLLGERRLKSHKWPEALLRSKKRGKPATFWPYSLIYHFILSLRVLHLLPTVFAQPPNFSHFSMEFALCNHSNNCQNGFRFSHLRHKKWTFELHGEEFWRRTSPMNWKSVEASQESSNDETHQWPQCLRNTRFTILMQASVENNALFKCTWKFSRTWMQCIDGNAWIIQSSGKFFGMQNISQLRLPISLKWAIRFVKMNVFKTYAMSCHHLSHACHNDNSEITFTIGHFYFFSIYYLACPFSDAASLMSGKSICVNRKWPKWFVPICMSNPSSVFHCGHWQMPCKIYLRLSIDCLRGLQLLKYLHYLWEYQFLVACDAMLEHIAWRISRRPNPIVALE